MNTLQISFVALIAATFLSSCASPINRLKGEGTPALIGDEVVVYESCMGGVHDARDAEAEIPPTVIFVKDLVSEMFLCENFRGAQVIVFGNKVSINGRPVYAGYGYALADGTQVIDKFISKENFEGYYYDPDGKFKVKIHQQHHYIPAFDRTVITFMIVAKVKYAGEYTIGALSVVDFSHGGQDYTVFLWVHGLRLTQKEIVLRFEKILDLIFQPSQSEAGLK